MLTEEPRSSEPPRAVSNLASVVRKPEDSGDPTVALQLTELTVYYGSFRAVGGVTLSVEQGKITALIGPSGCGKTTILRSLNRMHDLTPGARVEGSVRYHGTELYRPDIDPVEVRRRIGMVFQRPNPFPKSIYDNVAYGPRVARLKVNLDDYVEEALRKAALWDDVKRRLKANATELSGGQQQRLCIARAIAAQPDVLLMDEPCSALDPAATMRIEDLMQELKSEYTIVIVTHNMQQAARVSDMTAFFTVGTGADHRSGLLVEYNRTDVIFTRPADRRTESYVSGRFG
jgi:phosphate transport system ATP-binding protein